MSIEQDIEESVSDEHSGIRAWLPESTEPMFGLDRKAPLGTAPPLTRWQWLAKRLRDVLHTIRWGIG